MSPAAFEAFYLGCVDLDYQTSGFRESYLQQVPAEDLQPGSCLLALDIALTGQSDGHGYCLACRGQYEQAGDILMLESGAWKGIAPEELVTPISELCAKYPGKVGQIVVEKASGGVPLLNQLRSRMPAHIQIQPQSHGSKSKLQRYEVMALPHFASGRVKVPAGASFILPLRDSFRKLLASSRGGLDQADACIYGIGAIGKQLEGGFAQMPVNWSGTGGTPATWSRGATAIDPRNNPSTEFGTWTTTPIYPVW